MVHSDLFKNVPTWPEPDIPGNNLLVQKSENLEPEIDPKLFGPGPETKTSGQSFEAEVSKKKLGKIELTIRAENEVYPKDAPYTQGATGLKFSSTNLTCLTLLVLLSYLIV